MKRITLFLVAVLIFSANKVIGQNSYLQYENFDSYTVGAFPSSWVLRYPGYGTSFQGVTDSEFVSAGNSLKLEGRTNNSANAEFMLSSTPNIVWLELRVKVTHEGTISYPTYPLALVGFNNNTVSSFSAGYACVSFNGAGSIVAGGVDIQTYNENQWYKVKIKYNTLMSTMDLWIDDVQKGTNMPVTGNTRMYNAVLLHGGNAGSHSIDYFDNIKAWDEIYTRIDDAHGSNSVQISLNQDNNVVTVNCTSEAAGQLVSIYNIQGQLKLQQVMLEGSNDINISELPKGLYIVSAGAKGSESIQKILK